MFQKMKGPIAATLTAAAVFTSLGAGPADARSRHHHGDAAVAGMALGMIGTIAALAAQDSYRDRYYGYGYYGGPAYAYAPRGYYGRHHYYYRGGHNNWRHQPWLSR